MFTGLTKANAGEMLGKEIKRLIDRMKYKTLMFFRKTINDHLPYGRKLTTEQYRKIYKHWF